MDDNRVGGAVFFSDQAEPFVVVLGANEIASAIAARLCREGFHVVVSHDPDPPVIRRGMAFYDALFEDEAEVDGIIGEKAETAVDIVTVFARRGRVAVTHLPLTDLITLRAPQIVIDARMQKYRVTPDLRGITLLAIGVGPEFSVDVNCDVAIETHPLRTGDVVAVGKTRAADGLARQLGGVGKERFVYAPRPGLWRTPLDIGAQVYKGLVLGYLDNMPILAPRDGRLRGIARDGAAIPANVKIVEIDPRGREAKWTGADERGRAIAIAVIEAIRRSTLSCGPSSRAGVTVH